MNSRVFPSLFALALGGILGFVAGKRGGAPSRSRVVPATGVVRSTDSSPSTDSRPSIDVSSRSNAIPSSPMTLADLRGEFRRLLRLPPEEVPDAAGELARRVPLALFPAAMEAADKELDARARYPLVALLHKRWVREDLDGARRWAESLSGDRKRLNGLAEVLGAWAVLQPAAALELARGRSDRNERLWLIRSVLTAMVPTDPAMVLRETRDSHSSQVEELRRQAVESLARTDPVAAIQELAGWKPEHRLRAVESVLSEWVRIDPDAAVAWTEALPSGFERMLGVARLSQLLGSIDPERGLRLAETLGSGERGADAVHAAFSAWSAQDPAAAEVWLLAQPASQRRRKLMAAWVSAAASLDPLRAVRFLDAHVPPREKAELAVPIAWYWAQKDADAARAWAETLPAGSARERFLGQILTAESDSDPAAAIQKALQLAGTSQASVLGGVFQRWVEREPAAAAAWLEQQPPGTVMAALSGNAINQLAEGDPRLAARLLMSVPSMERQVGGIDNIVLRWATSDLPGAVEFVRGMSEGVVKDKAVKSVAGWWAQTDPRGAFDYSVGLPEGESRREVLNQVLSQVGRDDPALIARWAGELPAGDVRNQALKAVSSLWVRQDPQAALAWLESQPAGEVRRSGVPEAVEAWAASDPNAAAAYALKLADPAEQSDTVRGVLGAMANSDPSRAAAWLAKFPAGDLRTTSTPVVASAWAQSDPQAAAAWLLTLPADGARFQALQPVADRAADRSPEWAWQWAAGLSEPRERAEAMARVGGRWLRSNPAAARAAFANTELPPETRKFLERGK